MIERISVVLPAPLRPISPVNFPVGNSMLTSRRMLTEPIETSSPSSLTMGCLLGRGTLRRSRTCAPRCPEERRRVAVGDDAALVEREHALGVAADDVHVVLDEQHGHALRLHCRP